MRARLERVQARSAFFDCMITMQFAEWALVYAAPLLLIWLAYLGLRQRADARAIAARDEAIASGLSEPASLHPKIDLAKCMGCGSCVSECPARTITLRHQEDGQIAAMLDELLVTEGAAE